ncbi:reverse transcriptase domain-containing protein [Tanacetum coccineum]
MDTRSGKSISKHEGVYNGTANGNRTKTQGRTDNVPLRGQRGDKCSPPGGKGLTANANLFCQSRLASPEINYSPMEKMVLELVHATRRLRRYFQAHLVAFELEAFDITYRPRTSIRGQVLADFIAKKPDEEEPPVGVQTKEAFPEPWVLFTDGSSCLEGSGAGLILTSPEGEEFTYALRFKFNASNNEAEYEALIAGLRI